MPGGPTAHCWLSGRNDSEFRQPIASAGNCVQHLPQTGVLLKRNCVQTPAAEQMDPIPDLGNSDSFHGIIAAHSGRRGAQRDAVHRASNATHPMGRYDSPRGPGAFSRPLRCAPLVVHVPWRDTRLAGGKNRSGEMGRCYRDLV